MITLLEIYIITKLFADVHSSTNYYNTSYSEVLKLLLPTIGVT